MFVDVFNTVTTTLTTVEGTAVVNMAHYLKTFAGTAATIIIIMIGLQALAWVEINVLAVKLYKALLTTVIVMIFALNADQYNSLIGNNLMQLPDDLMQAIMPAESGDTITIGKYLDDTVNSMGGAIGEIWKTATWKNFGGPAFLALALFMILCALGAAAMVSILYAKIGITLIVSIGPLYVLFLIAPYTRDFFTKWLSYALHFALVQVLIGGVVLIAQGVLEVYIQQLTAPVGPIANSPGAVLAPAIVMLVLAAMFALVPSMASSITGGIGLGSAVTPGAIGGAAAGAAGALFRLFRGQKNGGGSAPAAGDTAGGGTVSEGAVSAESRNAVMRSRRYGAATTPKGDAPPTLAAQTSGAQQALARMQQEMRMKDKSKDDGGNKK